MKRTLTLLTMIFMISTYSFSQNGWTQLSNYPGSGAVSMAGVSVNAEMYAGQGWYNSSSNNFKDWWQYNPTTNSWTSKASLTGSKRYGHNSFSGGNSAYVCLGTDWSVFLNDLWQYDVTSNTWVQKANFPGTSRFGAIAEATSTKAYVGLGEHDAGSGISDYFNDFYEYDIANNTWTAKATFPGQARNGACTFLLDGKIYVVGGRSEDAITWLYLKDTWAYDIATDTWTQKTAYPGNGSFILAGFALGQYAYVGIGYSGSVACADFWQYDPAADAWVQLQDFPGGARYSVFSCNIGHVAYMGGGFDISSGTCFMDFWKFDGVPGINTNEIVNSISLYPVPASSTIDITGNEIHYIDICDVNGRLLKHVDVSILQNKVAVDISGFASGVYCAKIGVGRNVIAKKIIKN